MKNVIICFACFFVFTGVFAQNENGNKELKNEFGMNAGVTTGTGLSYRFWPGKVGFQITLLPIKTDNYTWISTGLTGLVTFHDSKYFRFFGFLGTHYYRGDFWDFNLFEIEEDFNESDDENEGINVGIGPGFGFGTKVRFNLMAGYGFYDVLGEFNMYPTVEMGLYFRF